MSSTQKKVFFLFFFIFFQVVIPLVYLSSYEHIVTGFYLLFLVISFFLLKLKFIVKPSILYTFVLFLLFTLISLTTTISLPLSLLEVAHYLTIFATFIFFYNFQTQEDISPEHLGASTIFSGMILSILFVVYFLFPQLSLYLNGINVFTANYGHSHFSAYLLLLIPLAWWFLQTNLFSSIKYKKVFFLFLYLLLLITFGRLALILSLFQLITLYLLSKYKHSQKRLVFGIGVVLFLSVSLSIVSSLFFSTTQCYSPVYRLQLCKSLFSESRPTYFKHAILAIADKPILGFGPGTYEMISAKYAELFGHNSYFVHNTFLQVIAETGLIAGFFFCIFFCLLVVQSTSILKQSYQKKFGVLAAFALGFTTLFINSFFDFDWDLFPILNLSVVFAAMTFWKRKNRKKYSTQFTLIGNLFWLGVAFLIVLSSIVIVVSKNFIKKEQYNFAFDLSSYYYPHYVYFLPDGALSEDRRNEFYSIYSNHLFIIQEKINSSKSPEEKKQLYEEKMYYSAWNQVNAEYLGVLYELHEYEKLVAAAQDALQLLRNAGENQVPEYHDMKSQILEYQYMGIQGLLNKNDVNTSVMHFALLLPEFYEIDSEIEHHHIYTDLIASDFDWSGKIQSYFEFLSEYEVETFIELIDDAMNLYVESNASEYSYAPYLNEEIALLAMQAGDRAYVAEKYFLASKLYSLAVKYDTWVFNVYKPLFLDEKMGEIPVEFLLGLHLGRDSYVYFDEAAASQYYSASVQERELGNIQTADKLFKMGQAIAPWRAEEYEN